jgi:hypothetical protein
MSNPGVSSKGALRLHAPGRSADRGARPVLAFPWDPFDPDGPLPDLSCLFSDMFRAGMADGSVRHIPKATSEATLRSAITRNGGEKINWDR